MTTKKKEMQHRQIYEFKDFITNCHIIIQM